jgi:hypothetical protein
MKSIYVSLCFTLALGVLASPGLAKNKKTKAAPKDPQDAIEVVGHIAATDGPVTRFLVTPHYSSYYLYAEHEGGKNVTVVDITNAAKPKVLSDVSYPTGGAASLFAVTGTAALITEGQTAATTTPASQAVRIMNFSDPAHPQVAREFTGVTAMSRDDARGLIFVANSEGIWVLHQSFALDPEVEREYANHVLYAH